VLDDTYAKPKASAAAIEEYFFIEALRRWGLRRRIPVAHRLPESFDRSSDVRSHRSKPRGAEKQ
jgi:hypothetical protein